MVKVLKTGAALAAAWLLGGESAPAPLAVPAGTAARLQAVEAPAQQVRFKMVLIPGKDVSGRIYKKLGLPSLQYCWDACVREAQCTGARWGVIQGDVAGLCLLLSGELSVKESVRPRTEDGKAIQVTAGRKQALGAADSGT
jgi:hypothetical protein